MSAGKNASLAIGIVHRAVPVPQGEGEDPVIIYVRGLSPTDLTLLMEDDGGNRVGELYKRLVSEVVTPEDVESVGLDVLRSMPDLVAKIIARATDLPDQWEEVLSWSTGTQVDMIQAIAIETFRSEAVRKKALEIVSQFVKVDVPALKPPKPSKGGSGK